MIITLCGSTKFKDEFLYQNQRLTLGNNIVLMPGVFGHSDHVTVPRLLKEQLDTLHKKKIAMSDKIFIINKNGYIGESTRNEIEFAQSLNIPVEYMEEVEW